MTRSPIQVLTDISNPIISTSTPLLIVILVLSGIILYESREIIRSKSRTTFPTINAYHFDWLRRKAYAQYNNNARALLIEGLTKFKGPFQILTPNGPRLILRSPLTDWAKSSKDLDHQALVHGDFFADYPGFEGQGVVTNPDRILIDVTRTKLSQNTESVQLMASQMSSILSQTWTDDKDWHELSWVQDTMSLISRMSALVFVGPQLAANPEWQDLTVTYTVNVFKAVARLRQWPSVTRRIVHRLLPESTVCRAQVQRATELLRPILQARLQEKEESLVRDTPAPKHEDTITWTQEAAASLSQPIDEAAFQLAFAISALHTTSEAFRQVLLDLCLHPELLEPIRHEIGTVIAEHGLTLKGLAQMELLDSVMKESQRFASAIIGIERLVVRDTHLPDGTFLAAGTKISVDSSDMFSPAVHESPDIFDGYRFLRIRRQLQGSKPVSNMSVASAAFASSSKEHNTFGAGRFICPGRFFVANEMKIALAHVLLKYDLRIVGGEAGKVNARGIKMGFYGVTNPKVRVEVRRRVAENDF